MRPPDPRARSADARARAPAWLIAASVIYALTASALLVLAAAAFSHAAPTAADTATDTAGASVSVAIIAAALSLLAVAGPVGLAWVAFGLLTRSPPRLPAPLPATLNAALTPGAPESQAGQAQAGDPDAGAVPKAGMVGEGEAGAARKVGREGLRGLADTLRAFAAELLEPHALAETSRLEAALEAGDVSIHAREFCDAFAFFGVDVDASASAPVVGLVFEDRAQALALIKAWRVHYAAVRPALAAPDLVAHRAHFDQAALLLDRIEAGAR